MDRINEELLWKQPDGDSSESATKPVASAKKSSKPLVSGYDDDL